MFNHGDPTAASTAPPANNTDHTQVRIMFVSRNKAVLQTSGEFCSRAKISVHGRFTATDTIDPTASRPKTQAPVSMLKLAPSSHKSSQSWLFQLVMECLRSLEQTFQPI
jgi:hypothetical protein